MVTLMPNSDGQYPNLALSFPTLLRTRYLLVKIDKLKSLLDPPVRKRKKKL
jgi:hypothetical protein